MRTMCFAAAVAVAALLVGTPAMAQQAGGFRAEIHGGWDRLSGEDFRDDGILYGIGVGYDLPVGRGFLLGVEANADLANTRECETGAIAPGDELCVRARRDLSAAVRLGYQVSPAGQIYALAGYSNARFRADYTPAGGATVRDSENLDGLRLGVGYQHGFGNGLYSKVEYRYTNYEAGAERHQALVGIGFRF